MSSYDLQTLLDERQITALLNRYATALDEMRYDDVEACFSENVVIDFPGMKMNGRKGFAQSIGQACQEMAMMQHFSTNFEITVDGSKAKSRENCIAYGKRHGSEDIISEGGVYSHEFVKNDDTWLISMIKFTVTFAQNMDPFDYSKR